MIFPSVTHLPDELKDQIVELAAFRPSFELFAHVTPRRRKMKIRVNGEPRQDRFGGATEFGNAPMMSILHFPDVLVNVTLVFSVRHV